MLSQNSLQSFVSIKNLTSMWLELIVEFIYKTATNMVFINQRLQWTPYKQTLPTDWTMNSKRSRYFSHSIAFIFCSLFRIYFLILNTNYMKNVAFYWIFIKFVEINKIWIFCILSMAHLIWRMCDFLYNLSILTWFLDLEASQINQIEQKRRILNLIYRGRFQIDQMCMLEIGVKSSFRMHSDYLFSIKPVCIWSWAFYLTQFQLKLIAHHVVALRFRTQYSFKFKIILGALHSRSNSQVVFAFKFIEIQNNRNLNHFPILWW